MGIQTLNDVLLGVCGSHRDRVMLQRQVLDWVPISSAELYRNVVGVARTLQSWGISPGDRVAILSENRPEWTITDFAILSLGAVAVPIYSTQTTEQTASSSTTREHERLPSRPRSNCKRFWLSRNARRWSTCL